MNIDKYMKKAYGFFEKNPKEQKEKADKLQKIVEELITASKELNKVISETGHKAKRDKKKLELHVVNELLKKASKRLKKIRKE